MTVTFLRPVDTALPADTLDSDTERRIEEVLAAAAIWAAGEASIPETLEFILETPRTVGMAFRHRWHDPRRPALEALHAIEYGQRYQMVHTDFGWLSRMQVEQVERHMASPDFASLRYQRGS